MTWEMSQAESVGNKHSPETMCRWEWISADSSSSYKIGMGEGTAGIVYAFDTFAQRTSNPIYEEYAKSGAAYIESQMIIDGAVPETANDT